MPDMASPGSGVLAPTYVPVVTSDGLRLYFYFYALSTHFGAWVGRPHSRRVLAEPAGRDARQLAAVDNQGRPGDEGGLLAGQKQRGRGNLLGPRNPLQRLYRRCSLLRSGLCGRAELLRPHHRRIGTARQQAVHPDAVGTELMGQRRRE